MPTPTSMPTPTPHHTTLHLARPVYQGHLTFVTLDAQDQEFQIQVEGNT